MKLVLQRVLESYVTVDGKEVGRIGKGILCFVGVQKGDAPEKTGWFVEKMVNLRIFEDEAKKMNVSVKDIHGDVLVISQFTLYANCLSGRRPDFLQAAEPQVAQPMYEKFVLEVKRELGKVETGQFGASMNIFSINDGPVTIILEEKS